MITFTTDQLSILIKALISIFQIIADVITKLKENK
ncbi:hypothetical protein [Sigmofec virus UA08Rod_4769]|uniref:Uncharacterized protein n=1 Tax=Sigmofec virus UA08Rod_4769 TaxID=2929408 RepID=A0A976R5C4_9VIRU|nr:hypothetical protein [Sigmofec virus UA08Rod_4769]